MPVIKITCDDPKFSVENEFSKVDFNKLLKYSHSVSPTRYDVKEVPVEGGKDGETRTENTARDATDAEAFEYLFDSMLDEVLDRIAARDVEQARQEMADKTKRIERRRPDASKAKTKAKP